jgi:glycosyltransferase involved in cell wall biosynthesis
MLAQNFYPYIGGAELQALNLARALVKRGVIVTVLTRRPKGWQRREPVDGVRIVRLGRGVASFMALSFAWLVVFRRRYDVIHAHIGSSHAASAALAGWIMNKRTIVKISGSSQIGEIPMSRRSFAGRLKLRALGFFKPVLVLVSETQRTDLHGFGLESLQTCLIPNGVDTLTFQPASAGEKESLRQTFGWKGVVFLFVGRFSSDKLRVDIFRNVLKAWARLSAEVTRLSLYFVGQGNLEANYRTAIDELGLTQSVHVWPATSDVRALYRAADVFTLPSITEGLSNALLEAMACGLPVAGSRVPGIQDLLSDNVQGRLFDPLDSDEIYRSFRDLSQDAAARRRMGDAAMELARTFSLDNSVMRHLALYGAA